MLSGPPLDGAPRASPPSRSRCTVPAAYTKLGIVPCVLFPRPAPPRCLLIALVAGLRAFRSGTVGRLFFLTGLAALAGDARAASLSPYWQLSETSLCSFPFVVLSNLASCRIRLSRPSGPYWRVDHCSLAPHALVLNGSG